MRLSNHLLEYVERKTYLCEKQELNFDQMGHLVPIGGYISSAFVHENNKSYIFPQLQKIPL